MNLRIGVRAGSILSPLKPGARRDQAEAGISPLWYAIRADELKQMGHTSESFREQFLAKSHLSLLDGAKGFSINRNDIRTPLLILMAMVGLVALMACTNVGSLLLVRAAGRLREMSVRYALGAKRKRVIQQLLVEGLLLGLAVEPSGLFWRLRFLPILIKMMSGGSGMELPFSSHVDLRILLFNFTLTVLASLLFSLAPAVQFWRPNLAPALKQQVIAGGGPLRFRRIAVGLQIGLSLLLLVAAGLFTRTLHNLKTFDVGFATDHLVTFRINPSLAGYPPTEDLRLTRAC